jgi:WD40 repeat protein
MLFLIHVFTPLRVQDNGLNENNKRNYGKGLIIFSWLCVQVWFVKFSHDGKKLATGAKDGNIIVWDVTVRDKPTHVILHQPLC